MRSLHIVLEKRFLIKPAPDWAKAFMSVGFSNASSANPKPELKKKHHGHCSNERKMNGSTTDPIEGKNIAPTLHFSRAEDDTRTVLAQALEKQRLCGNDLADAKETAFVFCSCVSRPPAKGFGFLYNRLALPA